MATITIPNTLVDATTADPGAVNANFTAVTDGLSDGTKDITINTLTASNVVANGTVTADRVAVTNTLTVDGMLEGSRHFFVWWNCIIGNGSTYLYGSDGAATLSTPYDRYVMPRSGSVLAITTGMYASACANDQTLTPQIRKNAGAFAAGATLTVTNAVTGEKSGVASTFARATYKFAPGDTLSAYAVLSGTAGSAAMQAYLSIGCEVVYDT